MTAKQFFIRLGIIIAIILLIIGWMSWKGYQLQRGEISVVTEKTEYKTGEALRVKIKNNFRQNICFSSCYPYYLQHKNKIWENYKYAECHEFNRNGYCITAGKEKFFELTLPEVPDGLHRLAIPVCIGCKDAKEFKEDKIFYSNEFWIKKRLTQKVWIEKHLTQCAEEWQVWVSEKGVNPYKFWGEDTDTIKEFIKEFYSGKGIVILEIKESKVQAEPCEACNCLDDVKLHLQIYEKDKDYFLNQGYKETEKEEVTITTDKKKYKQGETVKITIRNNTAEEKRIIRTFPYIERFNGEKWIEIEIEICPCETGCPLMPLYYNLSPHEIFEKEWDQKETWCEGRKLVSRQVPIGKYRFKHYIVEKEGEKEIFSNEFLIQ